VPGNNQASNNMDIRIKVVLDCIKRLEAAGALYHIMDADGTEHGYALKRQVADAAKTPRKIDKARALERNKYVIPYMLTLEVGGDPVDIPYTERFTVDELQSNIGTRLSPVFGGEGSYITSRDNEKRVLQVILVRNDTGMGTAEAIARSFGKGPLASFVEDELDKVRVARKASVSPIKPVKKAS
jgi:hypothetical protein